jgi:hypothetical protein
MMKTHGLLFCFSNLEDSETQQEYATKLSSQSIPVRGAGVLWEIFTWCVKVIKDHMSRVTIFVFEI